MLKKLFLVSSVLLSISVFAQFDSDTLDAKLTELSKVKKGLNDPMKIDVSGLTLYDFINSIAQEHQINVDVDRELSQPITNNFFDVPVKDVLSYLVQRYDLEITLINNIIGFKKKREVKIVQKKEAKLIDVAYNPQNDFLSVKLERDTLGSVIKAVIDKSGKNVILAPDVKNDLISTYILNRPFDQVLEMMSKSNNLSVSKDENNFYYIQKVREEKKIEISTNSAYRNTPATGNLGFFNIQTTNSGLIDVEADEADVTQLLTEAAKKLNVNYYLYNRPENEKISLKANEITFEELLKHVFKGKKYTYDRQGDYYIIGEQITEGLRVTEVVQLENRSIESVLATLPKIFSEKIEVKEFVELNALIVSGGRTAIDELKAYLKLIDKVVPMIQIEVIIVQYNKSFDIQTGLKAGLDKLNSHQTGGKLFPDSEMNLNSTSVNSLIEAFNGFGLFKLGKVTSSFYLNLKLLENNSVVKVESTPKIATLSGHEAKLAIGETSYYFEQNNRLLTNSIGNDILQSGTWKSTDANLSVAIKPFVSTDENVTLNIVVEKSSFLGRAGETAPPGKATQKFESIVRIKNNEMILLGGLDELRKENSGTGTPLISRIPILKWFFSSRKKGKTDSKLHIFIRPSVVY